MSEVVTTQSVHDKPDGDAAKEHFANYNEYNKTLRTWFVTFGIGGPVALLINPALLKPLKEANDLGWTVYPFLIGCLSQVLVALLNKYASWYAYAGEAYPKRKACRSYKIWEWISHQFWIDVVADVVTVISFGFAIFIVLATFVRSG